MRNARNRFVRDQLLVFAALVLVAAACSGSSDVVSDSAESSGTTESATASESITTLPPDPPAQDAGDTGGGDFSVLMVGMVDELTATNNLESLEAAGIEGFVIEGSAEEGFNVYRSGLTREQAMDVLIEIGTSPDVYGGLIFETANLP